MLTPLLIVKASFFCAYTGYTEKAIERKRQSGVWQEGVHWYKAPDGNIMIDIPAYYEWVIKEYRGKPDPLK